MSNYKANPEKAICLDVETTGVNPDTAEIVQLSIIDYNGNTLFNEYIKPDIATEWPGAEAVHHISPSDVSNKKHLDYYHDKLKKIFNKAELIIAYNGDHYDIPIIARYGFPELRNKRSYDVMLEFAPIYGDWDDYHGSYTWQKLSTCAEYYDYEGDDNYHDSLEDVRATLYCFKKMTEDEDDEEDYDDEQLLYDDEPDEEFEEPSEYEYTDEDATKDTQAFWEGALVEIEDEERVEEIEDEYEDDYDESELPEESPEPFYIPERRYYGRDLTEVMHELDDARDPDSGYY